MPAALLPLNSTIVRSVKLLSTRARFQMGAIVAPERTLANALRLFLTPPRRPFRNRDRAFLASGEGFVVHAGATRLSAWRFGSPDRAAVILSHGWGGSGAQFHAFVPALVDAGYQAIVFDHGGHGYSEGQQASLVDFGRNLVAVADQVERRGGNVVGVIGHSLGAAAVTRFLRLSGRRVASVLLAPPASLVRYSSWFARSLGLGESLRQRLQAAVEDRLGVPWDELELPQAVASLATPALVIHDEDDLEVRVSAGLAIARAWPDARFVRTTGLGHNAILRDPGVVRDAVDFLAGKVVFPRPPAAGEWSAFPGPAPLI